MPLKCPDCYTPMKQDVLSGEKWHCCPDCGTGFSDEIYQETSYKIGERWGMWTVYFTFEENQG
ncbi:MAG: hypothetical protein A4E26_00051 [Methanobacterium sp. PtaU1.Bin097]|nr:MAG: hypothetical protein A4E26_00051 [Methanobacterium sp. PtaU1.Bin097]